MAKKKAKKGGKKKKKKKASRKKKKLKKAKKAAGKKKSAKKKKKAGKKKKAIKAASPKASHAATASPVTVPSNAASHGARTALNPAAVWPSPTGSRPYPGTRRVAGGKCPPPASKLSGPAWSNRPKKRDLGRSARLHHEAPILAGVHQARGAPKS